MAGWENPQKEGTGSNWSSNTDTKKKETPHRRSTDTQNAPPESNASLYTYQSGVSEYSSSSMYSRSSESYYPNQPSVDSVYSTESNTDCVRCPQPFSVSSSYLESEYEEPRSLDDFGHSWEEGNRQDEEWPETTLPQHCSNQSYSTDKKGLRDHSTYDNSDDSDDRLPSGGIDNEMSCWAVPEAPVHDDGDMEWQEAVTLEPQYGYSEGGDLGDTVDVINGYNHSVAAGHIKHPVLDDSPFDKRYAANDSYGIQHNQQANYISAVPAQISEGSQAMQNQIDNGLHVTQYHLADDETICQVSNQEVYENISFLERRNQVDNDSYAAQLQATNYLHMNNQVANSCHRLPYQPAIQIQGAKEIGFMQSQADIVSQQQESGELRVMQHQLSGEHPAELHQATEYHDIHPEASSPISVQNQEADGCILDTDVQGRQSYKESSINEFSLLLSHPSIIYDDLPENLRLAVEIDNSIQLKNSHDRNDFNNFEEHIPALPNPQSLMFETTSAVLTSGAEPRPHCLVIPTGRSESPARALYGPVCSQSVSQGCPPLKADPHNIARHFQPQDVLLLATEQTGLPTVAENSANCMDKPPDGQIACASFSPPRTLEEPPLDTGGPSTPRAADPTTLSRLSNMLSSRLPPGTREKVAETSSQPKKRPKLTDEEKQVIKRRRESNRLSAQKCRHNRKRQLSEKEEEIASLQERNHYLRLRIQQLEREIIDLRKTLNRIFAGALPLGTLPQPE